MLSILDFEYHKMLSILVFEYHKKHLRLLIIDNNKTEPPWLVFTNLKKAQQNNILINN